MVVVVMVVLMVIVDLIIVGLVVGQARDQQLTVRRMQTIESLYAAEAGMNMSLREMMEPADEDGDGAIGTISDDSVDATDPTIGNAAFVVTSASDTPAVGQTTLTSEGRSGPARRRMQAVLLDP